MATTYYNDIQKLYVAYFNRPGDPSGLAFWEKAVEAAKGSTATVAAEFAKQVEYTDAYAGKSNAEIVSQVYQNLFGRSSSGDTGADFWVKGLDNKVISIADVVTAVAAGAQGTDLTAYNNKVKAAAAFTAALDTDAEVAGYAGKDANAIAKAWLAGITTDATFAAATAPAQLNATVASSVAAGTTFTVTGALSTLNAANAAMKAFLVSADGDNDSTTSATKGTLEAAVTTATGTLSSLFTGTRAAAFAATDSASVKSALIGDQTTAYANDIAKARTDIATDTANVAKVTGLSAAVAARDAAQDNVDAATKVQTAAAADLAAKVASYNTIHTGAANQISLNAAGVASINGNAVFTADASGKLSLVSGVTETTNSGITAILNASNAKETADLSVVNATKGLTAATNEVNHLDFAAGSDEVAKLATVKGLMTGQTTSPTEAQITTYLTNLQKAAEGKADGSPEATTLKTFSDAVDAYHTAAIANPLVDKLDADTGTLDTLTTNSAKFNAAAAALNSAQSLVDQYAGYDATVTAAKAAFTNAGYNLVDLTATGASGTQVATTLSDVYVAGKIDTSISLFGLQGKDAISIGSGYTLNTGKLSTGDNAKLEVFVAQNGADTTLKIEAHAFSSSVTSAAAPELVTITLVGVTATDVHLDANGIITVG